MSEDESDTVWITSRGRNGRTPRFHTDPDCPWLDKDRATEKVRHLIEDHRLMCKRCSGEADHHVPGPEGTLSTRERLLEMSPEDAGLSPMPGGSDD